MIREVRKKKKKKKKRNSFLKFVLRGRRGGDRNFRPPTHQHASPHITDNYSFRSLRAPIVSGDPRVSDTLWGSPISLPPRSVRATHPSSSFLDSILVALVSPGCLRALCLVFFLKKRKKGWMIEVDIYI